ncbi:UNVERIFIED_CONTAM: hypothetical protein RMT77_005521 [Armadillidium vulgare]
MKVNMNFLLISAILLLMTGNFNEASKLCVKGGTGVKGTGNCPNTKGIITTCQIRGDHCYCDSQCSRGHLCCPYGCGPKCLKAVFE